MRAFEHTVGVCRNHYRVDLETAKRMVADAIKAARAKAAIAMTPRLPLETISSAAEATEWLTHAADVARGREEA